MTQCELLQRSLGSGKELQSAVGRARLPNMPPPGTEIQIPTSGAQRSVDVVGESCMSEKPRLVAAELVAGQPILYRCSHCGRAFILPEDRTPKEAAKELLSAFADHVREEHPEDQSSGA
jgi:hypothetical protein